MKKALSLLLLMVFPLSAQTKELSFEAKLNQYISDGYLDARETQRLKKYSSSIQDPEDLNFAHEFLKYLKGFRSYTGIQLDYPYRSQLKRIRFRYVPTYYEDQLLQAAGVEQVLAHISQRDALKETREDENRCGASALLAGHYVLYGSFDGAFKKLGMRQSRLSYKKIHVAQELLYRKANRDGQVGLSEIIEYTTNREGRVKILKHKGEIGIAAQVIGLKLEPLKITVREELLDRQKVILNLWKKHPNVPLLVNVYLNPKTGKVYPPDGGKRKTNHAVLVFRKAPHIYMFNSGILDNGNGTALRSLSANEFRRYVSHTSGNVNVLLPE